LNTELILLDVDLFPRGIFFSFEKKEREIKRDGEKREIM
jgi:hypothetical protein